MNVVVGGGGGHANAPADLAVDLKHQFNGVAGKGRFVHGWPGGIEHVAMHLCVAQVAPECPADMRHHGIEHAQQYREPLGDGLVHLAALGLGGLVQGVEHLHAGRDHGVVLPSLHVEVRLLEQAVDLSAQVLGLGIVERYGGGGLNREPRLGAVGKRPQATQKTKCAIHARIGPLQGLLGRGGKHGEQARRVRAVAVDQGLGIDAIVF